MKHLFYLLLLTSHFSLLTARAQYAPQAGANGTTAIAASSSQIVSWATHCTVKRGYLDIAQASLGYVSSGDSSLALGAVDNFVVSLGDSGVATLTFANPIVNGNGYDFAVFENGFYNPSNSEEAFLELAFVEVSSDGINFFRFPASSLTQTTSQLSSVTGQNYMNARWVNNLAGKYVSNYGTPFDLQELSGIAGLNINHITHVRIVDVVGSIGEHASYDTAGNKINDPYPTNFPIGGFDLDAVGVIHQSATNNINPIDRQLVLIYPNPANDYLTVKTEEVLNVSLMDVTGKLLKLFRVIAQQTIPLS
ncbi:MAG TPA: hypothetical protein PL009_06115 [Flavipsychrobacter sp.]|nr:hypothetical protein [Flavipsychrobacter sp.]